MSPTTAPLDTRTGQGWPHGLVAMAIGIFYFLVALRLGVEKVGGVDSSWQLALARDFASGAHWGRDVVFTYGPLAFLHPLSMTYPPLFPAFFVAQVLVTIGLAWLVGAAAYRLTLPSALLWLASLALWAPWLPAEVSWLIVLPLALHPLVHSRVFVAVPTLALLAVLGLIKINTLPPLAVTLFIAAWLALGERRHGRVALLLLGYPAMFLAGWLACRQSLHDLLPFLLASSRLAAGYGGGMSVEPTRLAEYGGLFVLLLSVGWCLLLAWTERTERRLPLIGAYGLLVVLVAWKSFYTRGDGHTLYFFCFAALLPWCLMAQRAAPRGMTVAAVLLVIATLPARVMVEPKPGAAAWADLKYHVASNLSALSNPAALIASRAEAWRKDSEAARLPMLGKQVGGNSIDVLGNQTKLAISNDLNYTHRPLIQSYAAYTPELARWNAAFFEGSAAPSYVLFNPSPIDGHLPAQEDALAFLTVLRRYRPVLVERGYTLAQRIDAPTPPVKQDTFPAPRELALGDWIDVPPAADGEGIRVSLELRPTLAGRALSMLLREPELRLETATTDGTVSNWKLLRPAAPAGFLISPLILTGSDWTESYAGTRANVVQRLRVVAPSWRGRWGFAATLGCAFAPVTLSRPLDPDNAAIQRYPYAGFSHAPVSQQGLVEATEIDGRPALFMHAPASIELQPGQGHWQVALTFGLRADAWGTPSCVANKADGVVVRVLRKANDGPMTLLAERRYDPFAHADERTEQRISVDAANVAASDRLRVEMAPAGNDACDWSFLREVTLAPVAVKTP